jgi:Zn-finger nucleic acid-binding protein
MKCPQCNHDFNITSDSESLAHKCSNCSGTWIRGHSLHLLLDGKKDARRFTETLDSIHELEFRPSRRKCPSCAGRNLKAVVIEKTELDFCPSCKGLYFDPGELDRVFPGVLEQISDSKAQGLWPRLLKFFSRR